MSLGPLFFASPWFLVALGLMVAGVVVLWWERARSRQAVMTFPSMAMLEAVGPTLWARLFWVPDALRLLAIGCVVLAMARPQILGEAESEDAEGIDIVLALDTSCSMRAADFQPNDRMFVARNSVEAFVKGRSNDRVGVVVFAGEAASWSPLTLDYSMLVELLREVEVGMLPDGTAIGSAIGTALNRLRDSEATSKVIVLITDGDNNAGEITPLKAAQFAKDLRVRIYTILIGRGGPVPFPAGKDLFGRPVMRERVVPTNPELLKKISEKTGGESYTAEDGEALDQRLQDVLDSLEKTKIESSLDSTPKHELFSYFILAALLALMLEVVLRATRLRRFP